MMTIEHAPRVEFEPDDLDPSALAVITLAAYRAEMRLYELEGRRWRSYQWMQSCMGDFEEVRSYIGPIESDQLRHDAWAAHEEMASLLVELHWGEISGLAEALLEDRP
jgi:hypothetical protein